jgi:acid phosphatase type 7
LWVHWGMGGEAPRGFIPALAVALVIAVSVASLPAQTPAITLGPYAAAADAHSIIIRWETDTACPSALEWGSTADLGLQVDDPVPTTRHEVHLEGLKPGGGCYYRVEGPGEQTHRVHAAPDPTLPLRVSALGDCRSGDEAHRSVVAAIVADAPGLTLNSGDVVYSPVESQWRTYFSIEAPLLAEMPTVVAPGNHEGDQVRFRDLLAPPGAPGYHAVRWGGLAILVLDSNQDVAPGSPQYEWLLATLYRLRDDPSVTFRLVLLHWGPYDSGAHGSNLAARLALAPLFEDYGVAIVLSGHDHDYEHGLVNGVHYVVTGGGGAPLYPVGHSSWTLESDSAYHHCTFDVDGGRLDMEAREDPSNRTIDSLHLALRQGECRRDADCAGRSPGTCTAPEVGRFTCVATTCLWSCRESLRPRRHLGE